MTKSFLFSDMPPALVSDWHTNSYHQRFRAIFESLVMVDLWRLRQAQSDHDRAEFKVDWRSPFLAIASACATGQGLTTQPWAEDLQRIASHSREALVLAVLPVLLLHSNPYGHQRQTLERWGEAMGLDHPVILDLDSSFQHLCLAMATALPWSPSLQPTPNQGQATEAEALLEPIQVLVTASQGQFLPALQLAHHLQGSAVTLSWVGVLVAWYGGLTALPSRLRHDCLRSPCLAQHWHNDYNRRLGQLADGLYRGWVGTQPGCHQPSGLVVV